MPHVLHGVPVIPYGIIGYQQERDEPNAWTRLDFQATINYCINTYGAFLELFPNTINHFADHLLNQSDPPPLPYSSWSEWANSTIVGLCGSDPRRLMHNSFIQSPYSVNITEDEIHIENKNDLEKCHFSIYDLSERKIIESDITLQPGENVIEIKQLKLQSSIYIFKLNTSEFEVTPCKFFVKSSNF
jgi:hypothetical protein